MSKKPMALVVTGDGINCEQETFQALRLAGFQPEIRHLNDLIAEHLTLDQLSLKYAALALPGGFSFGDDLTSGKVLALKIHYRLGWNLHTFAERGGLAIGICNGFQALIRMGVFGKDISITQNTTGKFMNQWVKATPTGSKCVWLKGIGTMELPIRHGEGRIIFKPGTRSEVLGKMERLGMTCLRYEENPNGSEERLAGLCDSTGRIFGLMPHPEVFTRWTAHPEWTLQPARANGPGQGLAIFENAFQEAIRVS
jgi:phosphoribosylformylglycinamidine synthase